MASANVELVRSIFAAWERGDFSSAEWAHPEIDYGIADGPDPGRWTGVRGMARGWDRWLSAWAEHRLEAEAFRELDEERVLVLTRRIGVGGASGLDLGELRAEGADVFHIRYGKVTRLTGYNDRKRALADLGLTPESDSAAS